MPIVNFNTKEKNFLTAMSAVGYNKAICLHSRTATIDRRKEFS